MDLKGILGIFVFVVVGIALLQVIADKSFENTDSDLTNVTNVTHTWANVEAAVFDSTSADTRWTLTSEEYYSGWESLQLTNETFLTEGTDYNVTFDNPADTVTIQLSGTTGVYSIAADANETLANYNRYAPEYVQGSGTARTLIRMNSLWFALGILLIVAGVVLAGLRKWEII